MSKSKIEDAINRKVPGTKRHDFLLKHHIALSFSEYMVEVLSDIGFLRETYFLANALFNGTFLKWILI